MIEPKRYALLTFGKEAKMVVASESLAEVTTTYVPWADYLALRAECEAKDARLVELLSLANRAGTFKAANHNGRLLPDVVVDAIISASAPPLHPDFPDDDLYEFCRMVECHVLERLAAIDAGREG